jgi:peptidoglycan/xylan/chitin deacetylase (PgdA/CDA1 family)
MSPRLVVFTGDLSYTVRAGIAEIDRSIEDISWLIMVHAPPKTVRGVLRSQLRNVRRNGWRWIPYQLKDLAGRMRRRRRRIMETRCSAAGHTHDDIERRSNVRIITVTDIHAGPSLEIVRDFGPTLGLAIASPILRPQLFSIPSLGTLNLHKGKVPQYRGMPPAFWELWNEEREVGCTVHRVDDKLDTGDIVCETSIERQRYSTLRGLQIALDEAGIRLMCQAVAGTLSGSTVALPQGSEGATFRKPTLAQIGALERRLSRAQPRRESGARRWIKEGVFTGVVALSRTPLRRVAAPRATVLLYHRVSDDARDNLTVGIEQFDRQMEWLSDRCQALTLEQLLALEHVPTPERPIVSVTFDDGYLDNYMFAAPILERHGIPASFFVSTGLIGTDRPFPHDVRRGNARPRTMTWKHVRSLHDRGFTIGSHTVNHVDCAAEPEATVAMELAQSMADLKRHLGIAEVYFAYPFGGRQHMTPQRLELVKKSGYKACLSAYGGSNVGRVDRFNVLRGGIHWGFSDRAFMTRCLGLL